MIRIALPLTAILVATIVAGCLSAVPYTPVQRYSIVPDVQPEQREEQAGVLAVRPLGYAEPYTTAMVYRPDEYTVVYREAEEWAEPPRDAVTRTLIDALSATGYFSDVGTASAVPLPDYILTGELRRFDEMRTTSPPQALCEVRITVRQNQRPAHALLSRTYRESVPLEGASAGDFAEAMTVAVTTIVANATEDIVAAVGRTAE